MVRCSPKIDRSTNRVEAVGKLEENSRDKNYQQRKNADYWNQVMNE